MDDTFSKLTDLDERMWWFRALRANLILVLRRFFPGIQAELLDGGCGNGLFLSLLRKEMPEINAIGIDAAPEACLVARKKGGVPICAGSLNELPFAAETFDVVVLSGIFSQRSVDPGRTAKEVHRCLRDNGVLVVSVAAYNWLASPHDAYGGDVRRYTRKTMEDLLCSAGLEKVYYTYSVTFLLPVMAVRRKLMKPGPESHDIRLLPRWAEWLFGGVMAAERMFLKAGISLPFGGTLIMVAVKK